MIRRGLAGFVVVFAALAALPFLRDEIGLPVFYLILASTVLFWIAQATSWNILSGYSGYFSFGQGAFVGLGAYTTAVLTGRRGIDFFWTLPISAALGVILALAIGALAFRLRSFRGEIFALLTLAVPFILASLARVNEGIDGGQGVVVPIPEVPEQVGLFPDFLFLINLTIATAAVAAAFAIQNSRFGWALASIRDAEDVAEGLGVATYRYKMMAIAVSGLIGSVSGSVFALQIGFVTVDGVFGLAIPLFVIVMCVLGGRSHWLGPVIGAVVIVTMQDRLADAGFEGWRLIILGTILAVLVVVAPEGLLVRLRERPWISLAAFVGVISVLAVLRVWGEPLDWFVAGMVAAAVAALWPRRRRSVVSEGPVHAGAPQVETFADSKPAARPRPPLGDMVVEVDDVTRLFGGVRALDGVTLGIRAGDLVGLVGPNGSGKTTLVNLLSGAIAPTRGGIKVGGQDIRGFQPHRVAHIGVTRTYQIPRPFDSMTVLDNVAMAIMFGAEPRSLADARRAAGRQLEVVGLGHRRDAKPAEINLHERQLLEMARAVAAGPTVLLLDEAMAGLNPAEIDQAVRVVRRIHDAGITIVIVEHLLRVVNQLATRVVVLDRGTVLADGEPRAVMRNADVVRAYLGKRAHA